MTAQRYTASRLRAFRACNRLHLYRYALAIRGAETAEMQFGTIGHKALEAYARSCAGSTS